MAILEIAIAVIALLIVLGWFIYRDRISVRDRAIRNSLPEALDILTVMIEAGMSLDGAMGEVAARTNDVLGDEFAQVLRDIKAGADRGVALDAMAARSKNDDIETLVEAIKQSELMGTSLADVLRFQAADLRRRRRERAQRKAASARVKMMLPMVGCIFPVIWIVILGPALLLFMNAFHH
jgi:tight adherence protein C